MKKLLTLSMLLSLAGSAVAADTVAEVAAPVAKVATEAADVLTEGVTKAAVEVTKTPGLISRAVSNVAAAPRAAKDVVVNAAGSVKNATTTSAKYVGDKAVRTVKGSANLVKNNPKTTVACAAALLATLYYTNDDVNTLVRKVVRKASCGYLNDKVAEKRA